MVQAGIPSPVLSVSADPDELDVAVVATDAAGGTRLDITVRNPRRNSDSPLAANRVVITLDAHPTLVMEHGWQSWSLAGPLPVDRPRAGQRIAPSWVRHMLHADGTNAGRSVVGDQFLLAADGFGPGGAEGGVVGALSGRRNLTSVACLRGERAAGTGTAGTRTSLRIICHLDGVAIEPGGERVVDPLFIASGDPGRLYSLYGDLAAAESDARRSAPSPVGWCTWYHYYARATPADIESNALVASRHSFDLIQIDECYEAALGDWTIPNQRFGDGRLDALAARIEGLGMTPGIWTAPFLASRSSKVATAHPEWLARTRTGRTVKTSFNPIGWGGWGLALDTTNPAFLDHLRSTYSELTEKGWTYHKIDFLYAAAIPARRSGSGRWTRAESLVKGLEAVREGIGNSSYLLACGCPLAQAVGIADAMRVSPDTAALWTAGPMRIPGYPDVTPSTRSALRMTLLRSPLHRRLFVNDPDCLLLRPRKTLLTPRERRIASSVAAGTGGLLLVSDDLSTYGETEWALFEEARRLQRLFDQPLRLVDPFANTLTIEPEPAGGGAGDGDGDGSVRHGKVGRAGRARIDGGRSDRDRGAGRPDNAPQGDMPLADGAREVGPMLEADVLHPVGRLAMARITT